MYRMTALATILAAGPMAAQAQSNVETDVAPQATAAPVQAFTGAGGTWTGGYAGLQLG